MDSNVAYWIEDANGNLMLYNQGGQFLDSVPKSQASSFVAAFSSPGNPGGGPGYDLNGGGNGAGGKAAGGGSGDGPAWANINLRGQELNQSAQQFGQNLAENQRQFNENMGADKSKFDQQMALDQATQKWKEAVDARDFEAANFWKSRSQELQQNSLALDYTKTLAGLTGPQDWIKYGRLSRGESPLNGPDGKTVPLDQALPAWAQGVKPGTYGYGPQTQPSYGFGALGGQSGAGGPGATPAPGLPKPGAPGAPQQPAWAQNVKIGTPPGAGTLTDTPGGPSWAWGAKPGDSTYVMPKDSTIAMSGLPDQNQPIKLSDWAIKNGAFK